MTIQLIFRSLGTLSNLILCVISLRAFRMKSPDYARAFSILCWLEAGADILIWLVHSNKLAPMVASEAVVIGEILCFSFIFYRIVRSRVVRWITGSLMALILALCLWSVISRGITHHLPGIVDFLPYLLFLIPGFAYFREVFIYKKDGDLLDDFSFWLVTGLLFACAATVVNILGLTILAMLKPGYQSVAFDILFSFMFIITNSLFIKAYLCLRN